MNKPLSRNKIVPALVAVLFVAAIILLWLYYRHVTQKVEIIPQGNDRFGLAFISPPDNLADETRYGVFSQ